MIILDEKPISKMDKKTFIDNYGTGFISVSGIVGYKYGFRKDNEVTPYSMETNLSLCDSYNVSTLRYVIYNKKYYNLCFKRFQSLYSLIQSVYTKFSEYRPEFNKMIDNDKYVKKTYKTREELDKFYSATSLVYKNIYKNRIFLGNDCEFASANMYSRYSHHKKTNVKCQPEISLNIMLFDGRKSSAIDYEVFDKAGYVSPLKNIKIMLVSIDELCEFMIRERDTAFPIRKK